MSKPFAGSEGLLGKTIVRMLEQRVSESVLHIGKDAFYRSDLSSRKYYNFAAAANLSAAIAAYRFRDGTHIDSAYDLYFRVSPRSLAIAALTSDKKRSLGATALAALGPVFELMNLGSLKTWQIAHAEGKTKKEKRAQLVTFTTMKLQARGQRPAQPKTTRPSVKPRRRDYHISPSAAITDQRPRLRKRIIGGDYVNPSPAEAVS
jgi:hypothetical protein